MRLLKSFFIAFSIYSKIPVPQFAWEEEDMKYMLCFFPWIGAVIGICLYGWGVLCERFGIGEICRNAVGMAVPLAVTGGFHVDGFLDTMDAFHSYRSKEEKLAILKDSYIGAFAVIMLAVYGLVYLGAFSEVRDERLFGIVCMGFFLARCLSGIGVVCFPLAREDGMLAQTVRGASRKRVCGVLLAQCVGCVCCMLNCSAWGGFLAAGAAFGAFGYYYLRCKKELGGITGDTAGYFVLVCELCVVIAAAIGEIGGRLT